MLPREAIASSQTLPSTEAPTVVETLQVQKGTETVRKFYLS